MGQPVVHFEVMGKDAEKLQRYFGELFGWKFTQPERSPVAYGLVSAADNGGRGIGGGIGAGAPSSHVTFYVGVPNVEEALARAERLGGKRCMGPQKIGGGEIGLFTDPEGHLIGVASS